MTLEEDGSLSAALHATSANVNVFVLLKLYSNARKQLQTQCRQEPERLQQKSLKKQADPELQNGASTTDKEHSTNPTTKSVSNKFDQINTHFLSGNVLALENALTKIDARVKVNLDRLDEAERSVQWLESAVSVAERALDLANKKSSLLEVKTNDLENRGRRKNVVLINLPEKAEGTQPPLHLYLHEWLNLHTERPF